MRSIQHKDRCRGTQIKQTSHCAAGDIGADCRRRACYWPTQEPIEDRVGVVTFGDLPRDGLGNWVQIDVCNGERFACYNITTQQLHNLALREDAG